jgi:alkylhydroperoxidase family enzyme
MGVHQGKLGRPSGAIAYPDTAQLPDELQDAVTQRGSLNVYRMIMHSPGMAPGFLELADAVLQTNSLPAPWRELVILRVGHAYEAAYEVHHHKNLAKWVGLSDIAIAAAATGAAEGLPNDEAAILGRTDQLLAVHTLDDSECKAALDLLTVNQLADCVLTVGFYQLVCNFLNTFSVTTDGEGDVS